MALRQSNSRINVKPLAREMNRMDDTRVLGLYV